MGEDGYTYTGFSEGEPIKFYYQDSTDTYLLGKRSDTMYYFKPTLTSWSSVSSRYLPWGKTVDKCVFNPKTNGKNSSSATRKNVDNSN